VQLLIASAVVDSFKAYRIFEEAGKPAGRIVDVTLDEMSPGEVVIKASHSSVNYKDALAATGAGKVVKRFPVTGGIDVAGTVETSSDARFRRGDPVLVTGYDLGVSHDGGYAAYVRAPASWVLPIPPPLTSFDAMAIGTAGLTAGLSIAELEHNGLRPHNGPVVVTGATGGVGSLGVACLAALGYPVTALTGKDTAHDYLRSLGASEILPRAKIQPDARPLGKSTWAGAIDAVGGDILGWLTRTMMYGGAIACSGLTAGIELRTTVMPFILRAVKLIGIDSAACPLDRRREVWRRLASDMKPANLQGIAREITLNELPDAFDTLLAGAARGRYVVKL
jgi:NADPH2:quinone reductase